jgi:hypothetical protein
MHRITGRLVAGALVAAAFRVLPPAGGGGPSERDAVLGVVEVVGALETEEGIALPLGVEAGVPSGLDLDGQDPVTADVAPHGVLPMWRNIGRCHGGMCDAAP